MKYKEGQNQDFSILGLIQFSIKISHNSVTVINRFSAFKNYNSELISWILTVPLWWRPWSPLCYRFFHMIYVRWKISQLAKTWPVTACFWAGAFVAVTALWITKSLKVEEVFGKVFGEGTPLQKKPIIKSPIDAPMG